MEEYKLKSSGEANESGKRPDLLTILCILTFIGSGIAAFSNLFLSVSFPFLNIVFTAIFVFLYSTNLKYMT